MTQVQDTVTLQGQTLRSIEIALSGVLLVCAGLYVLWTWHWPLMGDASLMHYIAFLMDHGMAPYRDVPDMNLPGSFLIEWLVMHTYGGGSLAWRLFDLTTLLAMAAGLIAIAWPYDWFAGLFSGVLMMLIHGRDGIFDTGQRDLTLAALVVLGYVFLFHARRKQAAWAAGLFGFCMATAATLKPYPLPLALLLFILLLAAVKTDGHAIGTMFSCGAAGLLLPEAIVLVFLAREHAVGAFLHDATTIDLYFASLGRRPVGFLMLHSVSPLLVLVCLWGVLLIASGVTSSQWKVRLQSDSIESWERRALLLGAGVALAGYLVQGKGYPYQRYCFLVLLLLIVSLDLTRALRRERWLQGLALSGLGLGCLFLAPQSVAKVRRYDWRNQEYLFLMESDLRRLGGTSLSGHVQCMDTIDGCSNAFYDLRILPATGLLSDFLVFGSPDQAAVRQTRAGFQNALWSSPPSVILVTSPLFPRGPNDFKKLQLWPEFEEYLNSRYSLCVQRTLRKPVDLGGMRPQLPPGYRIYLLDNARAHFTDFPCDLLPKAGQSQAAAALTP